MSAIFGILYRDGLTVPEENRLKETASILQPRGPDGRGIQFGPGIGLVHTRLSFPSSEDEQPRWDDSKGYALVWDGRIYNLEHLRKEIEQQTAPLNDPSDTGILLAGLAHHGPEAFIPRLEGMFALGFWDQREKRLVIARDRMGLKPLSAYWDNEVVIFSSETRAMAPWITLQPDEIMITAFLGGASPPTQRRSFFRDVRFVSAGSILESRAGSTPREQQVCHVTDFWDPERRAAILKLGPEETVNRVEEILTEATKKHLRGNEVGGAFCSGGVDSSLMAAMAAKFNPDLVLFNADVKGPHSEYPAAKRVADHLNLDLQAAEFAQDDAIEYLPETIRHYEYPFNYHPNSIAYLLLCRLIQDKGMKAVLSGHGGDGAFVGYAALAVEGLARRYNRFLSGFRGLVHRVPKLGKFLWPHVTNEYDFLEGLMTRFEIGVERDRLADVVTKSSGPGLDPREYKTLDLVGYHSRTVVHRDERLAMIFGVETRFPFFDHDVLRFAANIPYRYKIRTSPLALSPSPRPFIRDKWVLRQVAARYLPKGFAYRRKVGFPATVFKRMTVHPEFFENSYIADMFGLSRTEKAHLLRTAERRTVVRMMFLEVWAQLFFCGRPEAELVRAVRPHVSVAPS